MIMRKFVSSFFLFTLVIQLIGCKPSPEQKAKEILKKAIEAHGGEEAWDQLELLKFRKWTRLLKEDGTIESETDQFMEFRLKPYLEGTISWKSDSVSHISSFNGSRMQYTMNGNSIQNPDFLKSKKSDFDAAFYVIAQPWKLLDDEGVSLTYEGQKTLLSGELAEVVRVNYGPDQDEWWYYFDPVTFKMLGNEVQLKDHRSLLENDSMEEVDPFIFYGERTSYRIDSTGKKQFVRAEYRYSDFEIKFENKQ
ncbi:hypothetical protein JYB64_14735 [Algoriphagus aestuarii]|nr:hypothetical protein [Algoriphagus aestuarii]